MKFYTKLSGNLSGNLYKFLLAMRFTIILFFVGIMQVSATTTYGQKITLIKKNITLKQVFKQIKVQTGYDVLWQADQLNANQIINVNFNQTNLKEVMLQCLNNRSLTFVIDDKSIVIKENVSEILNKTIPKDSIYYKGIVLDEKGKPLPGATVRIKGTKKATLTNSDGVYYITAPKKAILLFSFIGFVDREVAITVDDVKNFLKINLIANPGQLTEVSIVSTGYQDKSKESATGSFELITKEDLQHSTDPNLLRRLDGITTSLNFNPSSAYNTPNSASPNFGTSPLNTLTIRGRNTLNDFVQPSITNPSTSGQPLVVIDGIASAYPIDQLNPNDIESITILKDAAASSIWGSQAANGVIVVKTKKGQYNTPLRVSFSSTLNVTDKLNLFYIKTMSPSDYIDVELYKLKADGTVFSPVNSISNPRSVISPVDDIIYQEQQGLITQDQGTAQINALRGNDVRNDLEKYIDRAAVTQSYSLALDGGSKKVSYRFSTSYDNSLNNTVNSSSNRLVLTYNTSYQVLQNLSISSNIFYSQSNTTGQAPYNTIGGNGIAPFYPYTQLADAQGNALTVPHVYRTEFENLLASAYGNHILSYDYKPLDDINDGYTKNKNQTMGVTLNANYNIISALSANISYNYGKTLNDNTIYESQDSWFMRDLINQYTDPSTFNRAIPLGGYYNPVRTTTDNQTLRGALNLNKTWNKNKLTAIAGVDIGATNTFQMTTGGYYGYDPVTLVGTDKIDYFSTFNRLFNYPYTIPTLSSNGFYDYKSRTLSEYSNVDYSYDNKYNLSASIRKDGSSLFGPGTNKTGTPYYSIGGAWVINNESFYHLSWLPYLKLRATFGYNGNVNNSVIAAATIGNYNYNLIDPNTQLPYDAVGGGVTNSKLRPEKTGILNLAIDFGINNRLSGSFEYYHKKTADLLSQAPLDPSTGYNATVYNTADLKTSGIDFSLKSKNLQINNFSWTSNLLMSYNRVIVTKVYTGEADTNGQLVQGFPQYNVGSDLNRIFAWRWAGLDPNTGDPRVYDPKGILTVSATTSNSTINNELINTPRSGAVVHYFGSAVPVYFGSFRNTFTYGQLSISANLKGEFDFFFRRPISTEVNYLGEFYSGAVSGAEYDNRWQKPGDEKHTNVPSLANVQNNNRDSIYQLSDINVEKGDNIRLQEINLSYAIVNKPHWFLKSPRVYANINNLGIIWRANKLGLDPDSFDYPQPISYSLGFSANF